MCVCVNVCMSVHILNSQPMSILTIPLYSNPPHPPPPSLPTSPFPYCPLSIYRLSPLSHTHTHTSTHAPALPQQEVMKNRQQPFTLLQCVAVCCNVLWRVAVCCRVMQGVGGALQCDAVWCRAGSHECCCNPAILSLSLSLSLSSLCLANDILSCPLSLYLIYVHTAPTGLGTTHRQQYGGRCWQPRILLWPCTLLSHVLQRHCISLSHTHTHTHTPPQQKVMKYIDSSMGVSAASYECYC